MSLLDRKRLGLILRVFSPKPELVQPNINQIHEILARAQNLVVAGKWIFSRVDILVSADSRYGDTDCGLTHNALVEEIRQIHEDDAEWAWKHDSISGETAPILRITHVSEVTHGDIYCGMLNYGIACQMRDRIDYSMILSSGVKDYLTIENMETMLAALEKGAKVTGLAITKLASSIRGGRIANTCAIWHNESLVTVGGFDIRAAKPLKDERFVNYARGWSEDRGEIFYAVAGVEEIIPLVRLVKTFGPCIAPIVPVTGARWVVSDDPDVQKREAAKLSTKYERQLRWCVAEDVDFSFLRGGVMPEYR